jgi:hypothetical protein
LTAYHDTTRQPRAKIDLAKAVKLIDDKGKLTQPTKTGKGRRKSAFAEEDEAYQFVEEGFRMRFANGETIDFYADNAEDKEGWMAVLSRTVGKSATVGKGWCQLVLARERKAQDLNAKEIEPARPRSADGPPKAQNMAKASRSVPTSPVKPMRQAPQGQLPQQSPKAKARTSVPSPNAARRQQVQSMIF